MINLIHYFKALNNNRDQLIIVGDGPLDQEVMSLVEDSKNIQWLGHLSQKELIGVYAQADCLIIPSYTEAGPLTGLEAMASARLILSTKVGAMTDRLGKSLNNFWFNPDDLNSFKFEYHRIKSLSPFEVQKISEMNRESYIKNYSIDKISNAYLKIIDNLLVREN